MKIREMLKVLNEATMQEFVVPGFPGFYGSVFDPNEPADIEYDIFNNPDAVPEEILNYSIVIAKIDPSYEESVAEQYLYAFNDKMSEILPGFNAEFVEIWSPREYNFESDRIYAKIDLTPHLERIGKIIEENKDKLAEIIKEKHSSRSGFISFYSDNIDEWKLEDLLSLDEWELNTLFDFILKTEDENYAADLIDTVLSNTMASWDFDLDEIKKKFKFDVEPESAEDLEHYEKDENGVYVRK